MATIIAPGSGTIDAAFLQEISDVHDALWSLMGKVRHACTRPLALSSNARYFVTMLQELRDQMALHFALEEAYGAVEPPGEDPAHHHCPVERLRAEHLRLYIRLCGMIDRAEAMLDEGSLAALATSIPGQYILFDEAFRNLQLTHAT